MKGHPAPRRTSTLAAAVQLTAGLLTAGLLTALTACSTAVTGSGTFAGGNPPDPSGPTTTTSAAPAPPPTDTPGTPGDPGRATLSCAGSRILQPSNAPYCFPLPAGFRDVSAQADTTVGQSGEHPASVALDGQAITPALRDLIIVLDFTLRLDTDTLPDQVLVQQLNVLISQFETQGFSFSSRVPERTRLDGARGFMFHARARDGYASDIVFAFRGKQEVEVNCQFKIHETDSRRGCGSILATLQFIGRS
jgi:hypothetical protein